MSDERYLEQCENHLAEQATRNIAAISSKCPPGRRLATHCQDPDCGDELPGRRADAGYTLCVDCAELREMRSRH